MVVVTKTFDTVERLRISNGKKLIITNEIECDYGVFSLYTGEINGEVFTYNLVDEDVDTIFPVLDKKLIKAHHEIAKRQRQYK